MRARAALGESPGSATTGVRFIACSTGASSDTPRRMALRKSPSVARPTRRPASSTTRASRLPLFVMHSSVSRSVAPSRTSTSFRLFTPPPASRPAARPARPARDAQSLRRRPRRRAYRARPARGRAGRAAGREAGGGVNNLNDVLVREGATLRETLECITKSGKQLALVVDARGRLAGLATDGDLRKAFLRGLTLESAVDDAMNRAPLVADAGI